MHDITGLGERGTCVHPSSSEVETLGGWHFRAVDHPDQEDFPGPASPPFKEHDEAAQHLFHWESFSGGNKALLVNRVCSFPEPDVDGDLKITPPPSLQLL